MRNLCLLFFIIWTAISSAQDEYKRLKKIDSLLTFLNENQKFMGQVALRENGRIIFEKAYGYVDIDLKIKANAETQYKIGSITKTFTAVMIMQLIEEKKITLETFLSKFFPKIKNAEKITIYHLLHHRSGIKDYLNAKDFPSPSEKISKEELLAKIETYESIFEPNSKFEYSNSNYYLLGRIIEEVTKKDYFSNLDNKILKKIPLNNTTISLKADVQKNQSLSYTYSDDKWMKVNEWDMSVVFGAGNITSTASDVTKFYHALFQGNLVKKETLSQMMKLEQSYGKGLVTLPFGERKFYGHTGGIEGFRSVIGYYPPEKFCVSLIVNGDNFNRNDIMIGILSIYYKMPYQFPNLISVKVKTEVLNSYVGDYVSKQIPLKISIRNNNGEMEVQATGQNAFTLNAIDDKTFVFDPASIKLIFDKNQFTLKQGGTQYLYQKMP